MKRTIGFLMMVGLMVGIVGCGDDNNPVKSDEDLLVGTWSFEAGSLATFSSDGTLIQSEEGLDFVGTWSQTGDKLTITYSENDFRELVKEQLAAEADLSELSDAQIEELLDEIMAEEDMDFVVTINSITDTELISTDEDGEEDVATRQNQGPSNPPVDVDVQDLIDKGLETRMTEVSHPFSILFLLPKTDTTLSSFIHP